MQGPTHRKIIAGFVTIAGVVAIWVFGAARQDEQARTLGRQYVGEQWDVARNCLLGTPIGRGQDEETIRALLDRQLVRAMAGAVTEPDRGALWPARCVPLLSGLRADPSILRADPGDALPTLEVLAPRVLDGTPLVTRQARARAHELASAIARLDAAMPSGAEYDPSDYAEEEGAIPPAAVLGSLECAPARPARRPFLDARSGDDALYDELALGERSQRISGAPEGAFTLTTSSPEGTTRRELAREDARHPLLWDEQTLLWIDAGGSRLTLEQGGAERGGAAIEGPPIERAAICRTERGAHLVAQSGGALGWIAWPDAGAPPRAPVAVDAEPASGAFLACGEDAMILAWPTSEGWRGVSCQGARCEPMPLLAAGGDLQVGFARRAVAVARGLRSDLPVARALAREDGALGWSAPVPVVRGALGALRGALRLEACSAPPFTSEDGARWSAER